MLRFITATHPGWTGTYYAVSEKHIREIREIAHPVSEEDLTTLSSVTIEISDNSFSEYFLAKSWELVTTLYATLYLHSQGLAIPDTPYGTQIKVYPADVAWAEHKIVLE